MRDLVMCAPQCRAAVAGPSSFAAPLATIRLPVPVPFGFHVGWASDVNIASVCHRRRYALSAGACLGRRTVFIRRAAGA